MNFAVFDRAQDLLLHPQRDGCQFVEYQRAAVSPLEMSDMGFDGARKRARFVTEELGFQDRLSQGRAVDLDDRLLPPRGEKMQARCNQLLARAAFPNHQYRLGKWRGS